MLNVFHLLPSLWKRASSWLEGKPVGEPTPVPLGVLPGSESMYRLSVSSLKRCASYSEPDQRCSPLSHSPCFPDCLNLSSFSGRGEKSEVSVLELYGKSSDLTCAPTPTPVFLLKRQPALCDHTYSCNPLQRQAACSFELPLQNWTYYLGTLGQNKQQYFFH